MKKNGNGEQETNWYIHQIVGELYMSEFHDVQLLVVKMAEDICHHNVTIFMPEEPPDWSEPRRLNQHFDGT